MDEASVERPLASSPTTPAEIPARGRGDLPPRRDPHPRPHRIIAVLERAHAAEMAATGSDRIPAFRTTRALLGAACALGYTPAQLAGWLGMRTETLRNRASSGGWIYERTFAELAGRQLATVRRWERQGRLPNKQVDSIGRCYYLASDLLRALSGHPAPPPTSAPDVQPS